MQKDQKYFWENAAMFEIDRNHHQPYYQQIMQDIIRGIEEGTLAPDDSLPAERKLATLYGVNRSTVGRALEELVSLGWIERIPGSKTIIANSRLANRHTPHFQWSQLLFTQLTREDPFVQELKLLQPHADSIDLYSGDLPLDFIQDFQIPSYSWENVLSKQQQLALSGYQPLKESIRQQLKRQFNLTIAQDELLVTSGSTQGISIIFDTLLHHGDCIATEDPSFLFALPWLASNQIQLIGIPMDHEGIEPNALEDFLKQGKVKLLYLNPDFQNPTTCQMSLARRQEIIALCQKYQVLIIEDDVFGELNFKQPLPRLKQLAPDQVIYLGSLSKIFSSTIKIGWLCAPKPLLQSFLQTKRDSERTTDIFPQLMATAALSADDYTTKQQALLKKLQQRQTETLDILQSFQHAWAVNAVAGGFYLYLTWKGQSLKRNDWQLFLKNKLLIAPSFLYSKNKQAFRLNYAHLARRHQKAFSEKFTQITNELSKF